MENLSLFSPEDILENIIESRSELYDKRNKSFSIRDKSESFFNPIEIDYDFKYTKQKFDNDTSLFEEYNSLEFDINHFTQLSEEYGNKLSQYFPDELRNFKNIVECINKNFNSKTRENIVTINNPFRVQQVVINLILSRMHDLIKLSNEREIEQKIARDKEIEAEKKIEIEKAKEAAAEKERELEREQKAREDFYPEYRSRIRKTVNHWCSQVTTGNPVHSLGRLQELLSLLNYQSVPLVGSEGSQFIDLRLHPNAMDYFWADLELAVLTQAQTQFALNIDTALVFASLLAAVFSHFPDRLDRIMGALLKRCEEILMSDASTTDNQQADNDFDQDEQNVRGLSRFIAALSVARPPPGHFIPNNLGPGYLWTFLAYLSNSDLVSSLSAEACKALLEIGGTTLCNLYGDQFWKLLMAIRSKYENISDGLSIRSLIILIDEAIAKQSFELEGYVPSDVWLRVNE